MAGDFWLSASSRVARTDEVALQEDEVAWSEGNILNVAR